MDKLVSWINRRGRVTITEVMHEANKIIDLTPQTTETHLASLNVDEEKTAPSNGTSPLSSNSATASSL
jgi:hypothetical protein